MDILDNLADNTQSSEQLSTFIIQYNNELYDFLFTKNYTELIDSKDRMDTFILTNRQKLKGLNFNDNNTIFFLNMLLDTSERLGLLLSFQTLYNLLVNKDCSIGNRIIASSLYLIGIKKINDYELKLPEILKHLKIAYEEEEDNEVNVIAVIINFYAQLVNNFGKYNIEGVNRIREILISNIEKYLYLENDNIKTILNLDLTNYNLVYQSIQEVLDNFLTRSKLYPTYNTSVLLIEKDTDYYNLLQLSHKNYSDIQDISARKYSLIADDKIFYSLQRGVKILEEEKQLYAYMFSFGKMHYRKLTSAFDYLPKELFDLKIDIIDWGCGQGMASMSYCDYIQKKELTQSINSVTLIEPSEIALKRGALHVKKYLPETTILTINKDIDTLESTDFTHNSNIIKLHLFSNILDIDFFSLTDLTKLIEGKFNGTNYFVCVSPYVTNLKTLRLDSFCNHFIGYDNFQMITLIDNKKGGWINGWSRVIRIFKVDI
jgi:hypothetical protein